jgi:hypothetical protein
MRAICLIREAPHYRREAFVAGLEAVGFKVDFHFSGAARPEDVLVIWNRYGTAAVVADQVERAGGQVIVAENGYLAPADGEPVYALALGQHNGAGHYGPRSHARWPLLGLGLAPHRPQAWQIDPARPLLVCPQRGIGPEGVAQPAGWLAEIEAQLKRMGRPYRVRPHPGRHAPDRPLEADLAEAGQVIIWGSNCGNLAILAGVPVRHCLAPWIGGAGARLGLGGFGPAPDRAEWCEAIAWAQWRLSEIAAGEPYRSLLFRRR